MNRLSDLNNYSGELIEFLDERDAGLFFDRGVANNQTLTSTENATFQMPIGIEITDIVDYATSLPYIKFTMSNLTGNVDLIFPTLPAYITVTESPTNVFTVNGLRSVSDWNLVKSPTVQPPFSLTGNYSLGVEIGYINEFAASVTKTYTVALTLIDTIYLGNSSTYTYLANTTASITGVPTIIAEIGALNPTWTLLLTPSVVTGIDNISSSSGTGVTRTFNPTTKTYMLVGDKANLNLELANLEIEFNEFNPDFVMRYDLSNNLDAITEIQFQTFQNFELVSNMLVAGSKLIAADKLKIAEANLNVSANIIINNDRIREPNINLLNNFYVFTTADNLPRPMVATTITAISNLTTQNIFGGEAYSVDYDTSIEADTIKQVQIQLNHLTYPVSPYTAMVFDLEINPGDTGASVSAVYYKNNTLSGTFPVTQSSTTTTRIKSNSITLFPGEVITGLYINVTYPTVSTGTLTLYGLINDAQLLIPSSSESVYKLNTWGEDVGIKTTTVSRALFNTIPNYFPSTWTQMVKMRGDWTDDLTNHINWDTSNVTSFKEAFAGNTNAYIAQWDVSNVTNMESAFEGNTIFNQNLIQWDTSSVTNMRFMFKNASNFNSGSLNFWDISSVTDIEGMFEGASSFNGSLSNWNTSNISDMNRMFYNATSFNQNIGSWNTSNVTNMSFMFRGASAFNQNIGNWNTGNVTNMTQMFANATIFDQNLTGWCVTNISSLPSNFAVNSALQPSNYPVWGTCP